MAMCAINTSHCIFNGFSRRRFSHENPTSQTWTRHCSSPTMTDRSTIQKEPYIHHLDFLPLLTIENDTLGYDVEFNKKWDARNLRRRAYNSVGIELEFDRDFTVT